MALRATSPCEVVRCRSATRQGLQCRWSSLSDHPNADPLRSGFRFCALHARPVKGVQQDADQKSLDVFVVRQAARPLCGCADADPQDSGRAPAAAAVVDAPTRADLTAQQLRRIAENRALARERRSRRLGAPSEAGACDGPAPAAAPGAAPCQKVELTAEQRGRIAANRAAALETRRLRLEGERAAAADRVAGSHAAVGAPRSRSRTPPRARRSLTAQLTCSPPARPRSLRGPGAPDGSSGGVDTETGRGSLLPASKA